MSSEVHVIIWTIGSIDLIEAVISGPKERAEAYIESHQKSNLQIETYRVI